MEGSATAGWSRTSRPCSTALAAFGTSIAMPTRGLETTGLAPLKLSVASFAGMSFFDARREITARRRLRFTFWRSGTPAPSGGTALERPNSSAPSSA